MTIRLNGQTSGYVELEAPATAGSNTLVLPTGNGTSGQYLQTNGSGALSWQTVSASNLTRVTTQSATGSSITFGSLPSTVRKITILLNNVGTSGTDNLLILVGTSGGLITTGYTSRSQFADASSTGGSTATNGFLHIQSSGSVESAGAIELFNITGNIWVQKGITSTASALLFSAGLVDAGAQVTQVSIQFTGANTFDAGSFGLFYEV
jgi:hypothetical protein